MYNPSYLIRSRHSIYYFRYPLPQHHNKRVSISLKTRCPKEALRLSKALEYHAVMVISHPHVQELDYAEVKEILRSHFTEVLERMKRTIDRDGALTDEQINRLKDQQALFKEAIDNKHDEPNEWLRINSVIPEELSLDAMIQPIAERYNISTDPDSKSGKALRAEYKHAFYGYMNSLLAYNDSTGFYDLTDNPTVQRKKQPQVKRSNITLTNVVEAYLKEIKGKVGDRYYRDQKDGINYLIEVVGADFPISNIDDDLVRKIKEMLQETPINRYKFPETRDLILVEQIKARQEHNLKPFSPSNVNKYLGYMSMLFKWAITDKRIDHNPFDGVKVKENNTEPKRMNFSKDEIRTILNALFKIDTRTAINKTRYWGALLFIYTGARLEEIASLTPDDIINDPETGIWYINITDEEETNLPTLSSCIEKLQY